MKQKIAVGIDPGLATGGMIAWNGKEILETQKLGVKNIKDIVEIPVGDIQFVKTVLRAEKYVKQIISTLSQWNNKYDIVIIGIETFIDLPGKSKNKETGQQIWFKDRWKTPLVIGMLHPYLQAYNIHYQNPSILAAYREQMADLVEDYPQISSGHLASAWCHADYAWKIFQSL